ncbi:Oidioi.mRNA.OKI2018_I69.XSR.g16270.t1.cds [Oikopleura dioica]|uniref:Oidioi.mRNA.OKI2018_I69.XSR.g16270.t1.cds n=1 Tax=Oikopleura dioica TaxID=34765 RepID=A0ABN7SFI3_OIKDI|nr:Oidioi.mRNA.OKI2018_I69.XSR.g16270.t1.cds [Oikopleura dioica]
MKSMLRQVREARANAREARAMPKALGGAIGANKARDRLGTKNSNVSKSSSDYSKVHQSDFYEDDTDSMTNKLKDKQLNVLGIMRKLGGKQDENCTLEELLFDLGMSEDQFLIFGEIWRKYGRRDEAASLRQRDQFIFLKDLPALVRDVGKKCFVSASTASSVLSQKSNTVVSQIEE